MPPRGAFPPTPVILGAFPLPREEAPPLLPLVPIPLAPGVSMDIDISRPIQPPALPTLTTMPGMTYDITRGIPIIPEADTFVLVGLGLLGLGGAWALRRRRRD